MERRHLPQLDGLRGLAIAMVLVLHFAKYDGAVGPATRWALRLTEFGWTGVDLFFVLSGFLITGILLEAKGSRRFFLNFYARRTLRVFPLYYLVLAVVFVVLPVTGLARHVQGFEGLSAKQAWLWPYATNIKMALDGGFSFNAKGLYLSHLWSLAIEEHFYLVWPLIVFAFSRRVIAAVALACILAAMVLRIYLSRHGVNGTAVYVLTPCRMDALAAGSFVAVLASSPRAGLHRLLALAQIVFAVGLLAIVLMFLRLRSFPAYHHLIQTWGYTGLAIWYSAALVIVVESPGVASMLSLKWLRKAGKYSYGVYVLHAALIPALFSMAIADRIVKLGGPASLGIITATAVYSAICFMIAWLSFTLFEQRFLRLKRHFAT